MFGSNVKHDQDSQDNIQESRNHNKKNITRDFPASYTTQSTTLITDCSASYSKNQSTNFDNTVVVEALSNRFSIPTSKEYICKKCDKDLLAETMPMNSVASHIRLASNEPQQKCIHCNTVPTEKFQTFDKTKYGQNTIFESNERK